MSPILVRPVREQFEHDRVIRLLLARWRRRFEVGVNLAGEPAAPLRFGPRLLFPDLILTTNDRARRLHVVIEVETNESINHLEAMAQWVRFARVRAPFHLYVPPAGVEATRRLCDAKKIAVDEIWTYHTIGSQVRFALAYRAPARKSKTRTASRTKSAASAKKKAKSSVKSGRTAASRKKTAKPKAKKAASARKTKSKTTRAAGSRKTAGRAKTRATTTSRRSTARKAPAKRSSRR